VDCRQTQYRETDSPDIPRARRAEGLSAGYQVDKLEDTISDKEVERPGQHLIEENLDLLPQARERLKCEGREHENDEAHGAANEHEAIKDEKRDEHEPERFDDGGDFISGIF
jgi:hypothetical protein